MNVTLLGGGMITNDQLLPSLYHLQRLGQVGGIQICSLSKDALDLLAESPAFRRAFPGQGFTPWAGSYEDVLAGLEPAGLVVVALPDHLHFAAVRQAIARGQHVLCVKPLVLTVEETRVIEREASEAGVMVAIEYHKRFDDRSLMARQAYRDGRFGEFKLGTACLLEKWYYRHSNFQNWFTLDATDAFTYIGCHYVDLVAFITGLTPVEVSLYGLKDTFPNGKEGWLWTDARVIWSNGACLNVQNALGFPDSAPGSNIQGMRLYCANGERGAWIDHSDQYRGLAWCGVSAAEGQPLYSEPSPDYFQYVDRGGQGLEPVGYGYRSVEYAVSRAREIAGLPLGARRALLAEWDAAGILATPANSVYNASTIEAARRSLAMGGLAVRCE
jgi:predicted dehydrogenase